MAKIKHEGIHAKRLEHNFAEKIFADRWAQQNKESQLLRQLLNTSKSTLELITQRDADVAATIVQWLGSNVGKCFVKECLKDITKVHEDNKNKKCICKSYHSRTGLHVPSCPLN